MTSHDYGSRLSAELRRLAAVSPCSYVQTEGPRAPNWCAAHDEPMAVVADWCSGQVDRAAHNIRLADANGDPA